MASKENATLKVKYEALKEIENGRANKDVEKQFSIPGSTLATWKKTKQKTIFDAQKGAMDDLDPFKGMVDDEDGEDDNAVEELEFDLNQLRETRPGVAPENLDAGGLVDFVR